MKYKNSLQCSQECTTKPYLEPDVSSSNPHTIFHINFNIILPSTSIFARCPYFKCTLLFQEQLLGAFQDVESIIHWQLLYYEILRMVSFL